MLLPIHGRTLARAHCRVLLYALLSLGVSLPYAAVGENAISAEPTELGFSATRLARIDAKMHDAVENGVMVGGEGLIARRGKVVYRSRWGLANRESKQALAADSLYRIYSMSKPITAVALLMLYEEGHFLLGDPIAKYLPELTNLQLVRENPDGTQSPLAPQQQPTIRDLLRHSAGMSYGVFGNSVADRAYRKADLFGSPTLGEFTERLGQLPLLYEPGTRWHYSVAVDVQGRLVEVISGMPFGEFLQTRIFDPLGMRDTFFQVPQSKQARLTELYSPEGTTLSWDKAWQFTDVQALQVADPELTRPYLDGSRFESGGAGLVSTTEDYLRFALMLAGGGALEGTRLLAPGTVRHMRANHSQELDTSALRSLDGFGLGVGIVSDTGAKSGELGANGTYGWAGAAGTLFWIDPANDIVGVFMVQSIPHQTSLSKIFRVLTYQALLD
ncbi:MAG: CubicO group peptidase (beta-lactamase class C family) [Halieaceae bacterium]|jgi:CubicO group peptidase (beta-lactamase class C family)